MQVNKILSQSYIHSWLCKQTRIKFLRPGQDLNNEFLEHLGRNLESCFSFNGTHLYLHGTRRCDIARSPSWHLYWTKTKRKPLHSCRDAARHEGLSTLSAAADTFLTAYGGNPRMSWHSQFHYKSTGKVNAAVTVRKNQCNYSNAAK